MDSLKTLFEKEEYQMILDFTYESSDGESLFYRASAYVALNQPEKAMEIFLKHRKTLFDYNPLATLKHNFELRSLLKEFDEAYEDYEEFRNYPYVSQVVEEKIKSIPSFLRNKEKESFGEKSLSSDKAKLILKEHKNNYDVLATLEAISRSDLAPYLEEVISLLLPPTHISVRTYALLLLVKFKYEKEVTFVNAEKEYHLIPKNLLPPFENAADRLLKERLCDDIKDGSVSKIAYSIYSDFCLSLYPTSIFSKYSIDVVEASLLNLAKDYLKSSIDLSSLNSSRDCDELQECEKYIETILSSVPSL